MIIHPGHSASACAIIAFCVVGWQTKKMKKKTYVDSYEKIIKFYSLTGVPNVLNKHIIFFWCDWDCEVFHFSAPCENFPL